MSWQKELFAPSLQAGCLHDACFMMAACMLPLACLIIIITKIHASWDQIPARCVQWQSTVSSLSVLGLLVYTHKYAHVYLLYKYSKPRCKCPAHQASLKSISHPFMTVCQKADLWSCGVVLYALLYGRYPFDADQKYYVRKIVAAEYTIPRDIPVSSQCRHLLQGLLVADPEERMSIQEVLSQPWFCQGLPRGALEMNHTYLAKSLSLSQVGGMCFNELLCCAFNHVVARSLGHGHSSVDLQLGASAHPKLAVSATDYGRISCPESWT